MPFVISQDKVFEYLRLYFVVWYGCLTLAGCQVPTKAALPLPSSVGQGKENTMKGSWVEVRAGRDQSLLAVIGKTESMWGN